jgi:hypothetical protein
VNDVTHGIAARYGVNGPVSRRRNAVYQAFYGLQKEGKVARSNSGDWMVAGGGKV